MKYKVGICDDEKGTCAELENVILEYFRKSSDKVETYVWNTGDECRADLDKGILIDILFLDIEMPGKNGIEIGSYIRETMKNQMVNIIYISSKTNYALELFQVHPYDFLVKPIIPKKVEKIFGNLLCLERANRKDFLYVVNGSQFYIPYGDIKYFRSNNKHIEVHTSNNDNRVFRGKLKDILEGLPEQFVRIGQSEIINMNWLEECHYDYVVMRDGQIISISQRYRGSFKMRLNDYNNGGIL